MSFKSLSSALTTLVLTSAIPQAQAQTPAWAPDPDTAVPTATQIPDGGLEFTPGTRDLAPAHGSWSPEVELEILPASRDMLPSVKLQYNANLDNGPLGAGWTLSFSSRIERRSATKGVSQFKGDDLFFIDGKELIPLPDGTFRALHDAHTIYTQIISGSEIIGWQAQRDGTTRTWGESSLGGSCINAQPLAIDFRFENRPGVLPPTSPLHTELPCAQGAIGWHLSKIQDPFNNAITLQYQRPIWNNERFGERLPSKLRYNVINTNTHHELRLTYAARPDVRVNLNTGSARAQHQRLTQLKVVSTRSGSAKTTHLYELNYVLAQCDKQSLLDHIDQRALDALGMPTTHTNQLRAFSYHDGDASGSCARPWSSSHETLAVTPNTMPTLPLGTTNKIRAYQPQLIDINADSLPDLVLLQQTCWLEPRPTPTGGTVGIPKCSVEAQLWTASLDSSNTPSYSYDTGARPSQLLQFIAQTPTPPLSIKNVAGIPSGWRILDLNRDGWADLFAFSHGQPGRYILGGPDGWPSSSEHAPAELAWGAGIFDGTEEDISNISLADVNGDGFVDIIREDHAFINMGQAPFFSPFQSVSLGGEPWPSLSALMPPSSSGSSCMNTTTTSIKPRSTVGLNVSDPNNYSPSGDIVSVEDWIWRHRQWSDVNGDGITDLILNVSWLKEEANGLWDYDSSCGKIDKVYLGTGTGQFINSSYQTGGPDTPMLLTTTAPRLNDPGTTLIYEHPTNHVMTADLDNNGRPELTQLCDNGTTTFPTIEMFQDHGIAGPTSLRGFRANYAPCTEPTPTQLPLRHIGLVPVGPDQRMYQTMMDLDGDKLADGFEFHGGWSGDPDYNPAATSSPATLRWWRNNRGGSQNRLKSIEEPHGAQTQIQWGFSARGDNLMPINLEVPSALETAKGLNTYDFSQGTYADSRFIGFGQVIAQNALGATSVNSYNTTVAMEGNTLWTATIDADGSLRRLNIYSYANHSTPTTTPLAQPYASNASDVMTGAQLDLVAPYYNPMIRHCELNFSAQSVLSGTDISAYLSECQNFAGEVTPNGGPQQPSFAPGVLAVMRGHDPTSLGYTDGPLFTFHQLLMRKSNTQDNLVFNMRDLAYAQAPPEQVPQAQGQSGELNLAPLPDPSTPTPTLDLSGLTLDTAQPLDLFRMLVTEQDYDHAIARSIEERQLQDTSKSEDTFTIERQWSTLAQGYAWPVLIRERHTALTTGLLQDREFPLSSFNHGQWELQLRHDTLTASAPHPLTREHDTYGRVIRQTTWGGGQLEIKSYDDCGQPLRTTRANGDWSEQQRDAACRIQSVITNAGGQQLYQYDGFGHRKSARQISAPNPDQLTLEATDPQSAATTPAYVKILEQPLGDQLLEKQYLDSWGKPWKVLRCKRDSASMSRSWPDTWTHLDEVYPCDPSAPRYMTLTWYDATTKLPIVKTRQVDLDALPDDWAYTVNNFDAFGRPGATRMTTGELEQNRYNLGIIERVLANGVIERKELDTVKTKQIKDNTLLQLQRVDTKDRVISQTDAEGHTTDYTYDGFGRLELTISPEVEVLPDGATAPLLARPQISRTYYPSDELHTYTDARGYTTTYTYDSVGRMLTQVGPDGATLKSINYVDLPYPNRRIELTNDLGATTTTYLDAQARQLKVYTPDSIDTISPTWSVTTRSYDQRGRLYQETAPWGEVTTHIYDLFGRPLEQRSTRGSLTTTTQLAHNARDQVVWKQDADGVIERWSYDLADRLTSHTLGEPQLVTQPDGSTVTIPARELKSLIYDAVGQVTDETINGARTHFVYNTLGCVEVKRQGWDPTETARPSLRDTHFTCDNNNRHETVTNGEGERTESQRDALGRVFKVEQYDDTNTLIGTRSSWFDEAGALRKLTDESGLETFKRYDGYGRVIEEKPPGLPAVVTTYTRGSAHPLSGAPLLATRVKVTTPIDISAGLYETHTKYLDSSNRETITVAADGVLEEITWQDQLELTRRRYDKTGALYAERPRTYHAQSELLAKEFDWLAPADVSSCLSTPSACPHGVITYTHTDAKRVSTLLDAQNNLTSWTRLPDSGLIQAIDLGGLTQLRYQWAPTFAVQEGWESGPISDPIKTTLTYERYLDLVGRSRERLSTSETEDDVIEYDLAGRPMAATHEGDEIVSTNYTYDDFGRLKTQAHFIAGNPLGRTQWDYQPNGLLEKITYPSNRSVSYTWKSNSRVLQQIDHHDASGTTSRTIMSLADFDDQGRARELVSVPGTFNQLRLTRAFDTNHRELTRTIDGVSAGIRVEDFSYDDLGRLERIDATEGGTPAISSVFAYDERDFLTQEEHAMPLATHTQEYTYNAAGLRTQQIVDYGTPISYGYGSGHKLISRDSASISWDSYGRQLNDHRGQSMIWGLGNQLIELQDSSGNTLEEMFHDHQNQRVARRQGASTHYYLPGLVSGQVMAHLSPTGETHEYVYTPTGTMIAVVTATTNSSPGTIEPAIKNLTGSTYTIKRSSSSYTERDYSAFGEQVRTNGTLEREIGFHQMFSTEAVGIQIAGVRAYDPELGRFMSPDPLGFASANDLHDSADLFRYAHHNPIQKADPTGYKAFAIVDGRAMDDEMYEGFEGPEGGSYSDYLASNWGRISIPADTYAKRAKAFMGQLDLSPTKVPGCFGFDQAKNESAPDADDDQRTSSDQEDTTRPTPWNDTPDYCVGTYMCAPQPVAEQAPPQPNQPREQWMGPVRIKNTPLEFRETEEGVDGGGKIEAELDGGFIKGGGSIRYMETSIQNHKTNNLGVEVGLMTVDTQVGLLYDETGRPLGEINASASVFTADAKYDLLIGYDGDRIGIGGGHSLSASAVSGSVGGQLRSPAIWGIDIAQQTSLSGGVGVGIGETALIYFDLETKRLHINAAFDIALGAGAGASGDYSIGLTPKAQP